METSYIINSPKSPYIKIEVTPGHFTTSNSHISHYIDMSDIMFSASVAQEVAEELAVPYISNTVVDTIICMEETAVVGAFLANELLQDGTMVMNSGATIHILSPTLSVSGQLIFQKSVDHLIRNRNVLLLVSSVSSGETVYRAMDCLAYYGGKLVGISALFAAVNEIDGRTINSFFDSSAIPDYHFYPASDCEMCKAGKELDAIVKPGGYSLLPKV